MSLLPIQYLSWYFFHLLFHFHFLSYFKSKRSYYLESDFCFPFKKIGDIDPNDQAILVNWYNSLSSKGSLGWNTSTDLCGQTGVSCDDSTPKRVQTMFSFLFFLFSFFFFSFSKKKETFIISYFLVPFQQN